MYPSCSVSQVQKLAINKFNQETLLRYECLMTLISTTSCQSQLSSQEPTKLKVSNKQLSLEINVAKDVSRQKECFASCF